MRCSCDWWGNVEDMLIFGMIVLALLATAGLTLIKASRVGFSPKKPKRVRENLPLLTVARAARKEDALAALETWKESHRAIAERLAPADFLVDSMRGRSTTWTRVRVNLKNIPEAERPMNEEPVDTLAPKPQTP